jgi:N-acyl-D-amino-acid deacylase
MTRLRRGVNVRARWPAIVVVAGLAGGGLAARLVAQVAPYDLVLRNARIVDGTGSPWFRADIGIRGDTIARIAPSIDGPASRTIDVGQQVVAPGFIDIHSHAARGIFEIPTADNYVRQGVTTLVAGPDGSSPVPVAPFLAKLQALRTSVNLGTFIGQGSIRSEVLGEVNRPATDDELQRMRGLVEQGMNDGAFGLSTGLFYVPGTFTPTDEVVELAKVAGRFGGIHVSHMRDETARVVDSVAETIAIGERGGLPTQVTHHKIIGRPNWGKSVETLQLVDRARARGVDVTIDAYPYTASSTSIQGALLPAWAQEGGRKQMLARLGDAGTRAKVKAEIVRIIQNERGGGDPRNIVIAACDWDASLAGRNLSEIARIRGPAGQKPAGEPAGQTPAVDTAATVGQAADAALWIVERGGCQAVFHAIGEEDLERILRHPATMIASDGEIPTFGVASPHPRSYGTFARVLAVYSRDRQIVTIEDAIRKMTAFPAARLGIADRGVVRPGLKADLVVFDPAKVVDRATFERPHQYAEGFSHVITNGQVVFEGGTMTSARPGAVLYGSGRANGR